MSCKGCGQTFKAYESRNHESVTPEIDYYVHCFDECDEYKKLNSFYKCGTCQRRFLSHRSMSRHCLSSNHKKDGRVPAACEGCGLMFDVSDMNKFYRIRRKHCLEECIGYQKLDLIRDCLICRKLFRNEKSLNRHLIGCEGKTSNLVE